MSYINETDFVIENKKLVYPEIVADGLQLYYDAKGKRDTDYHRDTMLDMSGNKNHGKLHNFAYEKHSGYKDGLVFDYIDDKLVRPTLNLKPDDFTFMLNGNIISFSPDGTIKRVQDGGVIESKGFNLVRNGDFVDDTSDWITSNGVLEVSNTKPLIRGTNDISYQFITQLSVFNSSNIVYLSAKVKSLNEGTNSFFQMNDGMGNRTFDSKQRLIKNKEYHLSGLYKPRDGHTQNKIDMQLYQMRDDLGPIKGYKLEVSNVMAIDLTETFGAGNEPTKEQMDEIINRFGFIPNAQDLIDRIEYKGNTLGDMENIIDGLYKTEVLSGEEIYTDKADDSVVHVEVDGKSYQHAGSGKNIFNDYMLSDRNNYIFGPYSILKEPLRLKPNTEYTFSYDGIRVEVGWWAVLNFIGNSGSGIRHTVFNVRNIYPETEVAIRGRGSLTFTTDDTGIINFSYYDHGSGKSPEGVNWITDILENPQLEEGSTATAYEPPAPTPDYPIEINSLNDFDVVSSKAINMFNSKDFIKNGVDNGLPETNTTLIEVDGYYGFQHRLISFAENYFNYLEGQFEENTGYTFSFKYDFTGNNELSASGMRISYTTGVSDFTTFRGLSDSGEVSIKTDPKRTVKNISVRGWAHGGSFKVWKISLIKTNDFKEYIPNVKDITESNNHPLIDKINLLLDEPLRSVGDVKDRLFRDNDGVWKIERNVGEMVLDGSRGWSPVWLVNNNHGAFILRSFMPNINLALEKYSFIKSDKFVGVSRDDLATTGSHINKEGIAQGANYLAFRINIDRIGDYDVETFQNWLRNNPVTIYYYLSDKSYIETLDQELQDKLNNLRSFEDSNYVYTVLTNENNTVSNNLKPTLHAKFLYNNWYKEDRVINNLMIYNRALTNEEMLQNYKTIKRRWGM